MVRFPAPAQILFTKRWSCFLCVSSLNAGEELLDRRLCGGHGQSNPLRIVCYNSRLGRLMLDFIFKSHTVVAFYMNVIPITECKQESLS